MKKLSNLWRNIITAGIVASGSLLAKGASAATAAGGIDNDFSRSDAPNGVTVTLTTVTGWIYRIANILISVGVAIAVIFIIWGGISYMFAGGDAEKAGKAKTRLWNGVIGALIVLGSGLIIRTILTLVQTGI